MYENGRAHNIVKQMTRLNIQIIGFSETGQCNVQDNEIYCSGNTGSGHRNVVGILDTWEIKKYVSAIRTLTFMDNMYRSKRSEESSRSNEVTIIMADLIAKVVVRR